MAQYGYYFTKEEMNIIAAKYDWEFAEWQENIYMISYFKESDGIRMRINVYLTTMTIATSLDHPKKGKTQLYRRKVYDRALVGKIFRDPRHHTGKGYYEKI